MEPHWNPSTEEQALGRVYRISQTRDVTTVRYIMDNSIEKVGMPQRFPESGQLTEFTVACRSDSRRKERSCNCSTLFSMYVNENDEATINGEPSLATQLKTKAKLIKELKELL